jgi:hypothetical protein
LLGLLLAFMKREPQDGYWTVWAGIWAIASVVLPMFVVYHPGYLFPLTLGVLVLAGRGIGVVYDALKPSYSLAAYAWVGLMCLINLPSVVSYYADGNRADLRTPGAFVSKQWEPRDRVVTYSPRLLKRYVAPGIQPEVMKISDPLSDLRRLTRSPERLWIVMPSTRIGKPEPLAYWLGQHCSLEWWHRSRRFDYEENIMEVYLYTPGERSSLAQRE